MIFCNSRKSLLLATASLPLCVAASPAFAQTGADAAADQGVQIQDIIVTAQKRSENAQSIPIAVSAFSGDTLKTAGVQSVKDLTMVDPGLQVSGNQGIVAPYVRGLGTIITSVGSEQSVAVYIDDVYYVHSSSIYLDLDNIESVQLLKGPQGTLFGRNASAGVLSVTTRDPSMTDTHLEARAGYGNYNRPYGSLYVSTPITSNLAADFSLSGFDQLDGWGRSSVTNTKTYRNKEISARSKIVWTPTDRTTVKLIGYAAARKDYGLLEGCYPGTVCGGADSFTGGAVTSPPFTQNGFYNNAMDVAAYFTQRGYGGSLRIDQKLGFADFVSITAGRDQKEWNIVDGDDSPLKISQYQLHTVDNQISQEFQLKSRAASNIKWIVGLYYLHATQGYNPTTISVGDDVTGVPGLGYQPAANIVGYYYINSYSAFAQTTIPITDRLNITGGLRYNIDKIRGYGYVTDGTGAVPPAASILTPRNVFHKLTYKAAIDYKITDNVMVYFNYGRGYKSASYNTLPLTVDFLKPEINDSYEIGFKSDLLNRRLRVNAALFRMDINNPQVQSSQNGLAINLNAGGLRSQGAELEVQVAPIRNLTVTLGGTYLDTKFTDFRNAPYFDQRPEGGLALRQCTTAAGAPITDGVYPAGNSCDATSNRFPLASKFRGVAAIAYNRDIDGLGNVGANFNLSYTGRFYWDSDNLISQRPTTILNGTISLRPQFNDHFTFRFWMKNITNREYVAFEYPQAGIAGHSYVAAPPRMYGGEIAVSF